MNGVSARRGEVPPEGVGFQPKGAPLPGERGVQLINRIGVQLINRIMERQANT